MANFCGGIRLDSTTLKIIDGVICDANAATVDRSKAVSTCGQLWDGALLPWLKLAALVISLYMVRKAKKLVRLLWVVVIAALVLMGDFSRL